MQSVGTTERNPIADVIGSICCVVQHDLQRLRRERPTRVSPSDGLVGGEDVEEPGVILDRAFAKHVSTGTTI